MAFIFSVHRLRIVSDLKYLCSGSQYNQKEKKNLNYEGESPSTLGAYPVRTSQSIKPHPLQGGTLSSPHCLRGWSFGEVFGLVQGDPSGVGSGP